MRRFTLLLLASLAAAPLAHARDRIVIPVESVDFANPAEVEALYQRIQSAAETLCTGAGRGLPFPGEIQSCRRDAIADAVAQADNEALTRLHADARAQGRVAPTEIALAQ